MLIEVGRHALEGARAVEYAAAEPEGMAAGPENRLVALKPFAVEKSVGLCPVRHRRAHFLGIQSRIARVGRLQRIEKAEFSGGSDVLAAN